MCVLNAFEKKVSREIEKKLIFCVSRIRLYN